MILIEMTNLVSITRPVGRVRIETPVNVVGHSLGGGITRPVGRVRIETFRVSEAGMAEEASPGRLAGCGLKHGIPLY